MNYFKRLGQDLLYWLEMTFTANYGTTADIICKDKGKGWAVCYLIAAWTSLLLVLPNLAYYIGKWVIGA